MHNNCDILKITFQDIINKNIYISKYIELIKNKYNRSEKTFNRIDNDDGKESIIDIFLNSNIDMQVQILYSFQFNRFW